MVNNTSSYNEQQNNPTDENTEKGEQNIVESIKNTISMYQNYIIYPYMMGLSASLAMRYYTSDEENADICTGECVLSVSDEPIAMKQQTIGENSIINADNTNDVITPENTYNIDDMYNDAIISNIVSGNSDTNSDILNSENAILNADSVRRTCPCNCDVNCDCGCCSDNSTDVCNCDMMKRDKIKLRSANCPCMRSTATVNTDTNSNISMYETITTSIYDNFNTLMNNIYNADGSYKRVRDGGIALLASMSVFTVYDIFRNKMGNIIIDENRRMETNSKNYH
jgi:hypothetical protein